MTRGKGGYGGLIIKKKVENKFRSKHRLSAFVPYLTVS